MDRSDGVINLCEMKYSSGEYTVDSDCADDLIHKMETFQKETDSDKAIHITLVTVNGIKKNEYSGIVQNVITAENLFK